MRESYNECSRILKRPLRSRISCRFCSIRASSYTTECQARKRRWHWERSDPCKSMAQAPREQLR